MRLDTGRARSRHAPLRSPRSLRIKFAQDSAAHLLAPHHMRMGPMKAIWRGQVIAESDRTLEVGGYRYFPRETVRMDLLLVAPKTQSDLVCPNGVQFYDVTDGAAQSRRAAWSYEAPGTGMQQVDHWISFWENVEIK